MLFSSDANGRIVSHWLADWLGSDFNFVSRQVGMELNNCYMSLIGAVLKETWF